MSRKEKETEETEEAVVSGQPTHPVVGNEEPCRFFRHLPRVIMPLLHPQTSKSDSRLSSPAWFRQEMSLQLQQVTTHARRPNGVAETTREPASSEAKSSSSRAQPTVFFREINREFVKDVTRVPAQCSKQGAVAYTSNRSRIRPAERCFQTAVTRSKKATNHP